MLGLHLIWYLPHPNPTGLDIIASFWVQVWLFFNVNFSHFLTASLFHVVFCKAQRDRSDRDVKCEESLVPEGSFSFCILISNISSNDLLDVTEHRNSGLSWMMWWSYKFIFWHQFTVFTLPFWQIMFCPWEYYNTYEPQLLLSWRRSHGRKLECNEVKVVNKMRHHGYWIHLKWPRN